MNTVKIATLTPPTVQTWKLP